MATQQPAVGAHSPSPGPARPSQPAAAATPAATALAVSRIVIGFVFVWAFADKAFGLGYTTPAAKAWIRGGSPAKEFLSHVGVGPLQPMFHAMAGQAWVDWAFMLAMAAIGTALILGVATRLAAAGGIVMMALLWLATYPPATVGAAGAPTRSDNPIVDIHVLIAAGLVVLAVTRAGDTLGLGRLWARLPVVRSRALLR